MLRPSTWRSAANTHTADGVVTATGLPAGRWRLATRASTGHRTSRNDTFRLESVLPDTDLVFTATGHGVTGETTVRISPGQVRDVVIELRTAAK